VVAEVIVRSATAGYRREVSDDGREVTYDFHRLMETEGQKARLLKCREFGQAFVSRVL
jgi:isocitrate dehydrogenase